jgi:hypothetical protein
MHLNAGSIFLLVVFVALLTNCLAFLAFGWRIPGTFRRPLGARLKAWAGVCLAVPLIAEVLLFADGFGNGNSPSKNRLLPYFDVPALILIIVALVLLWKVGRMPLRRGGSGPMSTGDRAVGRHAANYGGQQSDPSDQPEQVAEHFWDSGDN